LREILAGEEIGDFRERSLARGLKMVRRKRRGRRLARVGAGLLGVATLCLTLLGILAERAGMYSAMHVEKAAVVESTKSAEPGVKIINEEELFALFPNRPIALIGKPGEERIYFLDTIAANSKRGGE